jgi:hypothetical protein
MGWMVRFLFQRIMELTENIVQTFRSVIGDLLHDATASVHSFVTDSAGNSHVGGILLAYVSYLLVRRN